MVVKIKQVFLWFPKKIDGKIIWLRKVYKYTYCEHMLVGGEYVLVNRVEYKV